MSIFTRSLLIAIVVTVAAAIGVAGAARNGDEPCVAASESDGGAGAFEFFAI